LFLSENVLPNPQNFGLEIPILVFVGEGGNIGAKMKFSTPIISSIGNLELPVVKLQLFAHPIFLTHDAAACTTAVSSDTFCH